MSLDCSRVRSSLRRDTRVWYSASQGARLIYGVDYETRTMSGLPMDPVEAERLRCGSCARAVESLSRCVWDESLMVGSCCEVYIDHRCPACDSDNLEYSYSAVKCLHCGHVTSEAVLGVGRLETVGLTLEYEVFPGWEPGFSTGKPTTP